ncbi:MAG TPA: vWA domain-containing protein [Polyangia bacterium]|nr:vWA domain-containing protein [Polyangia bacterium]
MRFPDIREIALLAGFAVAGCGAVDPNHCTVGSTCATGGTGGPGGGGTGGTGGGGTGDTGGGGGGGNNCGVQNFMLAKGGTPDLLIVQDRSGSMMDPATTAGTGSKWASITAAIDQVVGQVKTIDWGLSFFSPDGYSCTVPTAPTVPCGANTAQQIMTAIGNTQPLGGTPTAEAVAAGLQYFQGNSDGNAHYMLLATDGLPMCDDPNEVPNAENAVKMAASAGVKTVVVGIGDDPMGDMTLTAMANDGGMPDTTPGNKPYYQVNTTTDLVGVLQKISGQIVSCSYALQMAPPNPSYVEIDDNNGVEIPRDPTHMNGWDFGAGNLSVIFYGAACDNLQKGVTTAISAVFGCPPVG